LAAEQVKIIQSDVMRYLAGEAETFDVIFIDPPFAMGLAAETCQWLEDKGWLSKHAKIYVEVESTLKLEGIPENWRLLKSKVAGEVGYHLFARVG
jgi:16S rRNA (guanine966-N2)-methyltransferase